jgi:alanyl-tRNA synthetase
LPHVDVQVSVPVHVQLLLMQRQPRPAGLQLGDPPGLGAEGLHAAMSAHAAKRSDGRVMSSAIIRLRTMSERLEQADTYLFAFDATVKAHATLGDRTSIVLDRSAFYPESGGQMADRGVLGEANVIDVQIDEAGVVHHVVEGALPSIGATVHGTIDAHRRRTFAALHTAQHVLSRALVDVARAETVSSRLGETACTIDVEKSGVLDAKIAECESIANRLVDEDRVVRAWLPSAEELASLALRRAPKQTENIRVVEVAGFDVSPCGGTHVSRTSQMGPIRIASTERYKGGTRITFAAGPRAREQLFRGDDVLRAVGRALVTPPDAIEPALVRLRAQLTEAQGEAGRLRTALARRIADELLAASESDRIELVLEEGGADLAQKVAAELTRSGARVAIVAAITPEGAHVIVTRGPTSAADCGALLRSIVQAAGGKGGGRVERAEGRIPPGADVRAAIAT